MRQLAPEPSTAMFWMPLLPEHLPLSLETILIDWSELEQGG
jgi:hypothetical protein